MTSWLIGLSLHNFYFLIIYYLIFQKHHKNIFLAILSGILLGIPWLFKNGGFTILFAFLPLLYIESDLLTRKAHPSKIFIFASLNFFIWNILATWWIFNASFIGVISAILINTSIMSFTFWLYHYSARYFNHGRYFILIVIWLSFEFIYYYTEISWPWLTLGYALSKNIQFIQWYEFTGVLGGSLWILISNIGLYQLFKTNNIKFAFIAVSVIIIPLAASIIIFKTYHEKGKPVHITILQPNIDPYASLPDGPDNNERIDIIKKQIRSVCNDSTDFVLAPEVYIKYDICENNFNKHTLVKDLKNFLKNYKNLSLITGIKTYKLYSDSDYIPSTAVFNNKRNAFYDRFNTVTCISHNNPAKLRHKSKLVVGVEKLPYPNKFNIISKLSSKFGGIYGSLGVDNKPVIFYNNTANISLAALICYESVYGEYVSKFANNGAELLFLSTNDGWWGNTPGYKQHLSYSSLRAIETRRAIARSANTGVSCFINQKGEILDRIEFNKKGELIGTILANNKKTFYVKHGNYIGRIASYFSICILLFVFYINIKKRLGQ